MSGPVKKRVKGYMASYEASLSRLEDAKRTECERLSREWSRRERPAAPAPCPACGQAAGVRRYDVERTVTTKTGPVTYARPYHYCEACGQGFFPRDEELGLDEDLSDDLQAAALDLALNGPFEAGYACFPMSELRRDAHATQEPGTNGCQFCLSYSIDDDTTSSTHIDRW